MAGQQSIDALFDDILENWESSTQKALTIGAKKIQEEISKKANECLDIYYKQFKPARYKRTRALRKAIRPYRRNSHGKTKFRVQIGVNYDASMLIGAYRSNSAYHQSGGAWESVVGEDRDPNNFRSDHGTPEAGWIVDNLLQGIHPVYRANSFGEYADFSEGFPSQSSDTLMTKFINSSELEQIVNDILDDCFIDMVKSNLGGGK